MLKNFNRQFLGESVIMWAQFLQKHCTAIPFKNVSCFYEKITSSQSNNFFSILFCAIYEKEVRFNFSNYMEVVITRYRQRESFASYITLATTYFAVLIYTKKETMTQKLLLLYFLAVVLREVTIHTQNTWWSFVFLRIRKRSSLSRFYSEENPEKVLRQWKNVSMS